MEPPELCSDYLIVLSVVWTSWVTVFGTDNKSVLMTPPTFNEPMYAPGIVLWLYGYYFIQSSHNPMADTPLSSSIENKQQQPWEGQEQAQVTPLWRNRLVFDHRLADLRAPIWVIQVSGLL